MHKPNGALLILPFLVLSLAWSGFCDAAEQVADKKLKQATKELQQSVVAIYTQDKKLIGAGTSISFSGLVLTAKHILEDKSEAGSRAPNYHLRLLIGTKNDTALRKAEVVAVHPFMDLAVLRDLDGPPIPPMKIAEPKEIKLNQQVTLIGHRQETTGPNLYVVRKAEIDSLERHGHIIVGRGADKGFSGGPLVQNEYVIGVIRNSTLDQATAVPIDAGARDYLRLHGIPIGKEGLAQKVDNIGELASRISLYEEILLDIQLDVNWRAALVPMPGTDKKTLEDFEIRVWYEKKLSSQPTFDARLSLEATPLTRASAGGHPEPVRVHFSRRDWLTASKGPLTFKNFDRDLKSANIALDDVVGFNVKVTIENILPNEGGEGKTLLRTPDASPGERSVCLALRLAKATKMAGPAARKDGARCSTQKEKN